MCGKECTFSAGAVFDRSGGRTTYEESANVGG
jgi:hypothetical protein